MIEATVATLPAMVVNGRSLLLAMSCVIAAVGIVMWIKPVGRELAWVVVFCGLISILVLNALRPSPPAEPEPETENIGELPEERRRELVRGASLHMRDMRARYSVRIDSSETGDRKCFSAEINTVKLGFIPVFLTDTTNDRQGQGYMAFVHDGRRWRGPGLPCPADQADAVRHAARCVAPLATEEETRF